MADAAAKTDRPSLVSSMIAMAAAPVLILLVSILIVAPLATILVKALFVSDDAGEHFSPFRIFTLLTEDIYILAFLRTLAVSSGAALIATVMGSALAWLLVRTDLKGARTLEHICQVPIFVPPFVGAVAWTLLAAPRIGIINRGLTQAGIPFQFDVYTLLGMIWVIGIYLAPYVMMIVAASLRSMDPSLEEAAKVSGLTTLQTAWRITRPLLAPAIASGAGIAFSVALGLFGTPLVLGWARQSLVLTSRILIAFQAVPPAFDVMAILSIYLILLSSLAVYVQRVVLAGKTYYTVTGKGFRPRLIELGGFKWVAGGVVASYLVLTVIAPVAVLLASALSTYTWSGKFSLASFVTRFTSDDLLTVVYNSVFLSVVAATLATLLGIWISWLLVRTKMAGRGVLEYLALMPISIPGMTFGVGVMLVWLYVPLPVYGTSIIIILAFVGRFMAYAVRSISSSLSQIHPELEESARVFGLGGFQTFRKVTLPLVLPSVVASWLLLFSFCVTELSMVILLYTSENRTLSILAFEVWNSGEFSRLAALSLLQMVIGVAFLVATRPSPEIKQQ